MKAPDESRDREQKTEDRGQKAEPSSVFRFVLSSIVVLSLAGCQSAQQKDSSAAQIEQLTQENKQLHAQMEEATAENEKLKAQVQVLSGLPAKIKLESIERLQSVKIGRFTGFYDKDKDGKIDKLIVYIEPMDAEGDKMKAPGTVDIQLWDLNKSQEGALLGQWHVTSDELKRAWFDTLLSTNYRCIFNIVGKVENLTEPLTVKISFTEYLTGRTFTDQRVIKPQLGQ